MKNNDLVRPGEAAERLQVDLKTLARWATAGRITRIRPGPGTKPHHRYRKTEIDALAVYNREAIARRRMGVRSSLKFPIGLKDL